MELKLEGVIATSAPEYEDGIRLFGPDLNNPTRRNQRRVGVGEQVFYLFVREISAVQKGQDKDSKMSIITSAIQD